MEMGEHSISHGESADLPHTRYERPLSHHSRYGRSMRRTIWCIACGGQVNYGEVCRGSHDWDNPLLTPLTHSPDLATGYGWNAYGVRGDAGTLRPS